MLYNKMTKDIFTASSNIFANKVVFEKPTDVHYHEFLEICLVHSGKGIHTINGLSSECKGGDYFIINHNTPHAIYPKGEMTVYNIVFTPDFIDTIMQGDDFDDIMQYYLFKKLFIVDKSTIRFKASEEIVNIFITMFNEYENKSIGYIDVLRSKLILLLIFTLRQANKINTALPQGLSSNFDDVISYIIKNYHHKITLKELSDIAFVSSEHLSREFKRKIGKNITDFIMDLRIAKAKELLINTSKSVSEISNIVGYNSVKHFSKVFAKLTDVAPSVYRRNYIANREY